MEHISGSTKRSTQRSRENNKQIDAIATDDSISS